MERIHSIWTNPVTRRRFTTISVILAGAAAVSPEVYLLWQTEKAKKEQTLFLNTIEQTIFHKDTKHDLKLSENKDKQTQGILLLDSKEGTNIIRISQDASLSSGTITAITHNEQKKEAKMMHMATMPIDSKNDSVLLYQTGLLELDIFDTKDRFVSQANGLFNYTMTRPLTPDESSQEIAILKEATVNPKETEQCFSYYLANSSDIPHPIVLERQAQAVANFNILFSSLKTKVFPNGDPFG